MNFEMSSMKMKTTNISNHLTVAKKKLFFCFFCERVKQFLFLWYKLVWKFLSGRVSTNFCFRTAIKSTNHWQGLPLHGSKGYGRDWVGSSWNTKVGTLAGGVRRFPASFSSTEAGTQLTPLGAVPWVVQEWFSYLVSQTGQLWFFLF